MLMVKKSIIVMSILLYPIQAPARELENPSEITDWSPKDRKVMSERWNRANFINISRGKAGAKEYSTISERAAFYDWFDQFRKTLGIEIRWPAAAWIVSTQMENIDSALNRLALAGVSRLKGRLLNRNLLIDFANEGNRAIFDDVFPKLSKVLDDAQLGKPLRGDDAISWDKVTLHNEQFNIVQPVYLKFLRKDPTLAQELQELAESNFWVYSLYGKYSGLDIHFSGYILWPKDRFDYGMHTVIPFYKTHEKEIDKDRLSRQQSPVGLKSVFKGALPVIDGNSAQIIKDIAARDVERRRREQEAKEQEARRKRDQAIRQRIQIDKQMDQARQRREQEDHNRIKQMQDDQERQRAVNQRNNEAETRRIQERISMDAKKQAQNDAKRREEDNERNREIAKKHPIRNGTQSTTYPSSNNSSYEQGGNIQQR